MQTKSYTTEKRITIEETTKRPKKIKTLNIIKTKTKQTSILLRKFKQKKITKKYQLKKYSHI